MKPGPAGLGLARELEPPAPVAEARWRDKGEADTERQRTRERQEATLAGLAELEYLRQRQELLVRGALRGAGVPGAAVRGAAELLPGGDPGPRGRLEEKFLEENILLLRKQLNCLRRRDAGLLNQLQELDKQISDLRLDVEKTSEEHLETDSRPSSGFYELSDGASGSLSNSSNSVFSECLSSCHSSTCFCSPLEANLSITDGCPKSSDVNPKYQCDLVSKNGNDVYRYPSPLHAVAVQSPMFLLCLSGNTLREEEKLDNHAGDLCLGSELDTIKTDSSLPSPSALWSHPSSTKKMDGYILSLVQKKTHPVRTNKPRTSVNADPTKGLLRNGSVCVRVAGALPQSNHGNPKNCKQVGPGGGIPALDPGTFATLRPWAKDAKPELLDTHKRLPGLEGSSTIKVAVAATDLPSKHLPRSIKPLSQDQGRCPPSAPMSMPVPAPMPMPMPVSGESPHENTQVSGATSFCKDSLGRGGTVLDSKVGVQPVKKSPPRSGGSLLAASPATGTPSMLLSPATATVEERPGLVFKSEGSSSQSLEEGTPGKVQFVPGPNPNSRPHRGGGSGSGSSSNSSNSRPAASRPRAPLGLHPGHPDNPGSLLLPPVREKTRAGSGPGPGKKCRFPDDPDSNRRPRRGASKGRRSQAELQLPGRLLGAHSRAGSRAHGQGHGQGHGHGHARDPVVLVAKPKHKRTEAAEYLEALRRARRARRDPHAGLYPVATAHPARPYASPYAHARARTRAHARARAPRASDSEYSAECESLFHSTVLDTSDDERSDFTANRFGDSESSASDDDAEAHGRGHGRGGSSGGDSSSDSDSGDEDDEEDEGAGGLGWARFVRGASGPEQLPRHGHGHGHGHAGAATAAAGAPATKASATAGRAVVKIKASHTLKKKILRFRSGSLKLMTTV